MLFGDMVSTLNHRMRRRESFQQIRKKITDEYIKGKGHKNISTQVDVPVTPAALFRRLEPSLFHRNSVRLWISYEFTNMKGHWILTVLKKWEFSPINIYKLQNF